MPTLPSGTDFTDGIEFEEQPSRTWGLDKATNRIVRDVEGLQAVRQAVEIILHVERFRWQIYRPYSGMEWEGLIGQETGYVVSELQRRIREALSTDDRIIGISNFSYVATGDHLTASFMVNSVYGDSEMEVVI